MNAYTRIRLGPDLGAPQPRNPVLRAIAGVIGLITTAAAVVIGAVLALFAAVAVAILAVVGSVLVFLTGLFLRSRIRRQRTREGDDPQVLEARKVGHAWVAYGWDQSAR